MLLRLPYLAASDRDKEIKILALRHQLLALQRQVYNPTFTDTDRAVLAGLLQRRHAATCTQKRRGPCRPTPG
ncbi:hypothetical protein [Streptomyces sp. NPDC014733]|uniref:hypothetical protein n=1 Tax=Streptomyces sp. NPDC014733 TaxID=3364885 RepID=UPI0036F7EC75